MFMTYGNVFLTVSAFF